MTQKVIGISLGNNTSAAIVDPKKGVLLAISEERLNGEKNTKKFPIEALKKCMDIILDEGYDEILIGISSYEVINDRTMKYIDDNTHLGLRIKFNGFYEFLDEYIRIECNIPYDIKITFKRVEHHEAHRLPAMYMSGFLQDQSTKTIAVTYDGFGDGVCGTIYDCQTNELLAREYITNSLGLVYQYVTGALGYKEHQHEGKITGLAALGSPKYVSRFKDFIIDYDEETHSFIPHYLTKLHVKSVTSEVPMNSNIHDFKNMLLLKDKVYFLVKHMQAVMRAEDADIAASVQEYTEQLITTWIDDVLADNEIYDCNIVLSGGLFANVKVNYAIKRDVEPKNLFVLPPMGDEGTAIGSALKVLINTYGEKKIDLNNWAKDDLYLGKVIHPVTFDGSMLDKEKYEVHDIKTMHNDIVEKFIALKLRENKIVCISRGHSEFGPRALGNHSILFDASEKETNDSLNERLNRTEFMPFAPITLDKFSRDLFNDTEGLEKTLQYMTISVPVTKEFEQNYKAAYHVDFTARPQVLSKPFNPILYNIIEKYTSLTGKKALINTSFNLHNHPIIFKDSTALDSFIKADLDVLLLDDKLIVKKENL